LHFMLVFQAVSAELMRRFIQILIHLERDWLVGSSNTRELRKAPPQAT